MNENRNDTDRRLDDALNGMFERRERRTDGPALARQTVEHAGELRRRRRHPVLVRALKLGGPLAAAAAILLVLLITNNPPDAEAAYEMAEQALSESPELAYDLTMTATFRDRTHEMHGKVYLSEGRMFCHIVESPRGQVIVGSDGEHYWLRLGGGPLVLFDDYEQLKEAARTNPIVHGVMHRVLRLDRLLAELREDADPTIVERRPEGPRIRLRPRRRRHDRPRVVENVELSIDEDRQRVERLVITLTAGETMSREIVLDYTGEAVDPSVFDYTTYVGEAGIVDPEAYREYLKDRLPDHPRGKGRHPWGRRRQRQRQAPDDPNGAPPSPPLR